MSTELSILGGLLAGAVIAAVLLWHRSRHGGHLFAGRAAGIDRLERNVDALGTSANGMAERIVHLEMQMEQQLRLLRERVDQVELRKLGERGYDEAIHRVQAGAGADELIQHCGLSRVEAELVALLHGQGLDKVGPQANDAGHADRRRNLQSL